ncbi:methyltransferase domain-containing protein [Streptomyces sp. NPDC056672]|uniref:methyltransferase domain-containing protein n=1 Tax=Streptomyces sp. NPDC056672 TaxID=3345906 RepID=UPI00367F05FC
MRRVTTTTPPDLWHHYGRARAATDRAVPGRIYWTWGQDSGPGADILGDLTGLHVGDLGAGAARHAAHLAVHHDPARVDAIDASAAQHAMALDLYGHLAPRLRLVHAEVTGHLRAARSRYDVLYSHFGAADFSDPHALLPACAAALRPGGQLVIATLVHYLNGEPAKADAVHTDIPSKGPNGEQATLRRWVLQEHVWTKICDQAGLTGLSTDVLPASGDNPRTADTLLIRAFRQR